MMVFWPLQVRKVGDFTLKLVAGMREDLDALSERVEHRDGDGDTEALLAVRAEPVSATFANLSLNRTSQPCNNLECNVNGPVRLLL